MADVDPIEQRKFMGWFKPLVLAGNLVEARRVYVWYSNSSRFGTFEEIVARIRAEVAAERLTTDRQAERDRLCRQQVEEALARADLSALEAIARESDLEAGIVEEALLSLARKLCVELFGKPDEEKEQALSTLSRHVLIEARAGSGKTSLLAMKFQQLHLTFAVPADSILVLAFNRKAASEIALRISKALPAGTPVNASTFHSMAYRAAPPRGSILDEKEFGEYVGKAMQTVWDEDIEQRMLDFFRQEITEFRGALGTLSPDLYRVALRSIGQIALGGEEVESTGEKWIADFLFEHGIEYLHRPPIFGNDGILRPAFIVGVADLRLILEYWDIDQSLGQEGFDREERKYWLEEHDRMVKSRRYWSARSATQLLETDRSQLLEGRTAFEAMLRRRLEEAGCRCVRLDDREIAERVFRRQRTRLDRMMVQFIQRAKKARLSPSQVEALIEASPTPTPRIGLFEHLAVRVYAAYELLLDRDGRIDFDTLLENATARILETKGECSVAKRPVPARTIDWLLIDEFQDFSASFNALVDALRTASPGLRIVAVGDDWQAINGFAGSELGFFRQFESAFRDGARTRLLTNRRSLPRIVDAGNKVMEGLGRPAQAGRPQPHGSVRLISVDDIWIERRNDPAYDEERKRDAVFLATLPAELRGNRQNVAARLLKVCGREITSNPEASFLLLARTNFVAGVSLPAFEAALRTCVGDPDTPERKSSIQVMTAHKSKGMEADRVIVLDAVQGRYPLLHPDWDLYRLFGKGLKDVLEEERRLFYVACTRARDDLLLIMEKARPAAFLQDIEPVLKSRPGRG